MPFCIGLTGNIGSGKSTAIKTFQTLGVSIISADAIAKELTEKGQEAYLLIKQQLGNSILLPNGELDRKQLRQIIFANSECRLRLESILHPLIKEKIKEQIPSNCIPYCVIEIPLLYRKADFPYLNRILLIDIAHQIQIQRIVQRDLCKEDEALVILKTQSAERLEQQVDDVLKNNGSIEELEHKIKSLHERYLQLATQS